MEKLDYSEFHKKEQAEFIGKIVEYCGEQHKIVDVDYNGALLIDKPARFTDTTAIDRFDPNLIIKSEEKTESNTMTAPIRRGR